MKCFLVTVSLMAVFLVADLGQPGKNFSNKVLSQNKVIEKCPENPDRLYTRQQVLEQLAEVLNASIPEYKLVWDTGFYVNRDGRGAGFFVHDLTDTSNKGLSLTDCINFKNNHIYHFAPVRMRYSFSHILILEDGNLKIFKSINCKDRGDKLEDVINYLNQKLPDNKDKNDIINRVKDYRKYGLYVRVDDSSLKCQEVRNEKNRL